MINFEFEYSLCVKNLPKNWVKEDLYNVFKEKGTICDIKIYSNEQYGFVNFTDEESLKYWIDLKVKVFFFFNIFYSIIFIFYIFNFSYTLSVLMMFYFLFPEEKEIAVYILNYWIQI
jgi:RNA recognition motif-containing protein